MMRGWKLKILGEIAEVQSGGTPLKSRNEYWLGDISWYSSGELNETFTKTPKQLITPKGLEESNAKLFPKGSLLIGMYDTAALKMSILDRDAAFNQAIAGVKPNENIDLKFILFAINSRRFEILNLRRGVRQKNLSLAKIKNIALPIPPLPEQKRIVAILDEVFEGIDKAIANTEKNLANSRELFESYLNAIFTQKGDGWVEKKIEDICESIIDCVNKTAPIIDEPSPFKMIRTTNIRNGCVNLDSVRYVTEETYRQWTRRQMPQKGDVLLTREAPMGEVGMLLTDDRVFLGQRIVSYRADPKKLSNQFLLYAFQSNNLQSQIHSFASGSTVQHMRVPDTKVLRIAVPSLLIQKQVVQNLDILLIQTQRLETIYRQKIAALKELKQSILQKVFTGELTADTPKIVKEEIAA